MFKRDIYDKMLKWKLERETGNTKRSLEINGARQVGKTTIINKFAKDNYKQVISIDLGNILEHNIVRHWINLTPTADLVKNYAPTLMKMFNPDFVDSPETVIIIDEIQESYHVWNLIRPITRKMESHLIITGSYLGKVYSDKRYFLPAGDLYHMRMESLSFEEFLEIYEWRRIYNNIDLYGGSPREHYEGLSDMFKIYNILGGYPDVINDYVLGKDLKEISERFDWLIDVFTRESTRYMPKIEDKSLYKMVMSSVVKELMNEKRGLPSLDENIAKDILRRRPDDPAHINKTVIYKAIYWMRESGLLGICDKCIDCDPQTISENRRYYLTDIGLAGHISAPIAKEDAIAGMIAESFAYIQLRNMMEEQFLIPNNPCFGTYGDGEIDFILANRNNGTKYAVEVKSGRSSSKTATILLDKKIVDYVIFAKGNTRGGIDGNKITIPLYLLQRFKFEDFTGRLKTEIPKAIKPPVNI